MAGLGNLTTTLITTKGLFTLGDVTKPGFTALTFGAGITPFFRLYLGIDYVPPKGEYVAAAGSRVYQPGEFADSLKIIDPSTGLATEEPWMVVPRDKENDYFATKRTIEIKLVWNSKEYLRSYQVSESKAKRIFEVINFTNMTKERIKVAVSGVKRVVTEAVVTIRKLRLRSKTDK